MSPTPDRAAQDSWPYRLWLSIFLLSLLAARLLANWFAQTDLVFDEAQYWSWSRELALGYFSKPPLLAWLIRGTTEFCGNGEACIRNFLPVLYAIASWFVFLTGRELYGARVGFWSAVVFNTLPVIAFLSASVTTDAPLLLCWSIALYLWTEYLKERNLTWALLLGLTIGIGLQAKYAMAYFPLCAACHLMLSAQAREALDFRAAFATLLIALIVISPNLYWNYAHGFVTFQATASSAGWGRHAGHLRHFIQFLVYQFVVYGPVLFFMLLWIAAISVRGSTDSRVRMLLAFSLPVLALITVQSLVSRTHGSWTTTAAPAASILVTAWLLERWRQILFGATLATNAFATTAMLIGPALPANLFPDQYSPFARATGWKEVAASVREKLGKDEYRAVAVDGRDLAAELLYYLRDSHVPLFVVATRDVPTNFEATRPFRAGSPEPVLFVSLRNQSRKALKQFASVTFLGSETITGHGSEERTLRFYRLSAFAGRKSREATE